MFQIFSQERQCKPQYEHPNLDCIPPQQTLYAVESKIVSLWWFYTIAQCANFFGLVQSHAHFFVAAAIAIYQNKTSRVLFKPGVLSMSRISKKSVENLESFLAFLSNSPCF